MRSVNLSEQNFLMHFHKKVKGPKLIRRSRPTHFAPINENWGRHPFGMKTHRSEHFNKTICVEGLLNLMHVMLSALGNQLRSLTLQLWRGQKPFAKSFDFFGPAWEWFTRHYWPRVVFLIWPTAFPTRTSANMPRYFKGDIGQRTADNGRRGLRSKSVGIVNYRWSERTWLPISISIPMFSM